MTGPARRPTGRVTIWMMRAVLVAIPVTICAAWSTTGGGPGSHDAQRSEAYSELAAKRGLVVLGGAAPAILVALGLRSRHDR